MERLSTIWNWTSTAALPTLLAGTASFSSRKKEACWAFDVCLIVDANIASRFLGQPGPVMDWLLGSRGNPRLVAAGKLREELARLDSVRRVLVRLDQAGRLRSADLNALNLAGRHLHAGRQCCSNDHHILALATVTGARPLATLDDGLARDFRNARIINRPRGSIYKDPEPHGHLLRHTPSSCGVGASRNRNRHIG